MNRSHSQAHARPDAKMGRRRRWDYRDWLIGPWAGAFKRSEKRQATRKRRRRDRAAADEL
jgi:hypothetical protein